MGVSNRTTKSPMSSGTPTRVSLMRQRHSFGYASSGDDACSKPLSPTPLCQELGHELRSWRSLCGFPRKSIDSPAKVADWLHLNGPYFFYTCRIRKYNEKLDAVLVFAVHALDGDAILVGSCAIGCGPGGPARAAYGSCSNARVWLSKEEARSGWFVVCGS
ncbi:hypothetical protein Dimus_023522 [Dionaea muscipula]